MLYLVAYDIPDDGTRQEVSDLLESYGIRVQRSLFELRLKSRKEFRTLTEKLSALIDKEADSVRFYSQCFTCAAKAEELGNFPAPFEREAVYFF